MAIKKILVIAPHPDDETLGCGGTLLRHAADGHELHWLIVTKMTTAKGFTEEQIRAREGEIKKIEQLYRFSSVHQLGLPTTRLDTVGAAELIDQVGKVIKAVAPEILYLPHRGDAHSDHHAVFDAGAACTKWFRYPTIKRVLSYETLSETDFALDPGAAAFRPNVFLDVTAHLDTKIKAMMIYASEHKDFPFPRSEKAIRALAAVRGASSGFEAAEAFMLLRERA
jgi:LmbE family N-acetylglucosaminyl deacetylase